MVLPLGTWMELNYLHSWKAPKALLCSEGWGEGLLTLLPTVRLVWCSSWVPPAESSLSAKQRGHPWRESAGPTPNESLSYWPLFPSAYSFRAWHQNSVTGTLYRVQCSLLAFLLYRVILYSQGAGVIWENLLQTTKNERELGIKTFPVMLLYSISSSSWTVVDWMWS